MEQIRSCPFCGGRGRVSFKDARFAGQNYRGDKKIVYRVQMSQEQFDALMEEVRAMSEPPYDETVNEEPAVAPMNQADISENSRYKELKVNPCAYGVHFSAVMDDEDGSIVVFGEGGWAMGYIDYPMGTANWIVTDECKPGVQRYWKTCSKCGQKKWFFNYIDARNLKQRYPLCECGAKIIGVEERFEFE